MPRLSTSRTASPAWADHVPALFANALQEGLSYDSGEVALESTEGRGRIFTVRGRVAWISSGVGGTPFTELLASKGQVSRPTLRRAFSACRKNGGNFAETLIGWGAIDRAQMRRHLREYNAGQLNRILTCRAPRAAAARAMERGYASNLLYRVDELLESVTPSPAEPASGPAFVPLPLPPVSPAPSPQSAAHVDIARCLASVMRVEGAIGAALVDWRAGVTLGTAGGGPGFDVEIAAAGHARMVRAKSEMMTSMGIRGGIEDMLFTLEDQIHLIRPLAESPGMFLFVAIEKALGNLGLARLELKRLESGLCL
ncbi:MAG: hypothetical protein AB8I08_40855 [Sandaracinaceae bacterium]